MEEIWKDIEGYEGIYQVSSFGNVRSLDRIDSVNRRIKGKIMKQNTMYTGYKTVRLTKNSITKGYFVHRLVAIAFIPNPYNLSEVGHKDESRNNNEVDNLEWVTKSKNANMPLRRKRISQKAKGRILSEEHKNKIREALEGERNPFYGKHHSEETKALLREKNSKYKGELSRASKKVVCDNKIFVSLTECSKYLNIGLSTLSSYLSGTKKMPLKFKERGLKLFEEE